MARPDYVADFECPPGTSIKSSRGQWYLYECHYEYDQGRKRSKRCWGAYLGHITEHGFVPRADPCRKAPSDVVEILATEYCYGLSEEMREKLRRFFPREWQRIYVASIIRAVNGPAFRNIEGFYTFSILSSMYPDLALSEASTTRLLKELGKQKATIVEYMKDCIRVSDDFIIVDGHRILSASKGMCTAEVGYDSKMRCKPQINVMYMFSKSTDGIGTPVFFEQFAGNTVDVAALGHMIRNAGILPEKCLVVGDKGCASEGIFSALDAEGIRFIMPLRRGSRFAGDIGVASRFSHSFSCREQPIRYLTKREDGFNVHFFYDNDVFNDEFRTMQKRIDKRNADRQDALEKEDERRKSGKGKLSDEERARLLVREDAARLANQKPEMGTIAIRTNAVALSAREVYLAYKQRGVIEDFFKCYDCTLGFDASYMRDSVSEDAWLFLNHLSATICIEAIDHLRSSKETSNISWDSLRQILARVRMVRYSPDGPWVLQHLTKKVSSLLKKIGIDPTDLVLTSPSWDSRA